MQASEVECADRKPFLVESENQVVAGCGLKSQQIHMGMFAAFGNVFSGTPDFNFIPFGWTDESTGELLAEAPEPVAGQVITSPTVFLGQRFVDITGAINPAGMDLSTMDFSVQDQGSVISEDSFEHRSVMTWDFSEADGDERFESVDVQAFRLFVTDRETDVFIRQTGTSGVLRNTRAIRIGGWIGGQSRHELASVDTFSLGHRYI